MRKHLPALLVLALLLPLAAQASSSPSISNLTYEGVNSNTGKMELSWDNVADMTGAKVQIKGGGSTDVWVNAPNLRISSDAYSTTASFQDLTSMHDTAYWLNFRVRVIWGQGVAPYGGQTPWASVRI